MRYLQLYCVLSGLLLSLSLWSCQSDDDSSLNLKERADIVLSRSEEAMMVKGYDFALRLFQQINRSEKAPNWMVSPLSVQHALGMLANGADGNTLEEIMTTMGFEDASVEECNEYYKKLTAALVDLDNTTHIGIANSLWIRNDFSVYDTYTQTVGDAYDADVNYLDFASSNATDVVNRWSAEKTNNMITKVVDESIIQKAMMLCLNALSFKGIWKEPFKESETKEGQFVSADKTVSNIPMMSQENDFPYVADEHWRLLELPYGNEAFGMVVMLPAEETTLDQALEHLTAADWAKWNGLLQETTNVRVKLPRFEMAYGKDLIDDMKAMGMKDAFTPSADFSRLTSSSCMMGLFKHDTYIKVDEEGTKAAAVSTGGVIYYYTPVPYVKFHVNSPFIYFIKEKSTGTILFMGKISKL